MGQRIRSSLSVLIGAAEEATGSTVDPVRFMRALLRGVEAQASHSNTLCVAIGYKRLIRSYTCALQNDLAHRVACWGIHALGPDVPLRASYPLYRAIAESRGLVPWGWGWYQQNAFGYRKPRSERAGK